MLLSGCSQEHKVEHTLDCVVSSVVYKKTGRVINFKHEDAIKNGFVYHLRIYDDGLLIVNEADVYVKDKNNEKSFSLQRENRVDTDMKFQFSAAYDDVIFLLLNKDEEYHYVCTQEDQ